MSSAPTFALPGRVVLVTGAANGIGARTADELLRRGAKVVRVDTAYSPGQASREGDVLNIAADVTRADEMQRAVEHAVKSFGHLDAVIVHAGIAPPNKTLRRIDLTDFDRVIDVNLRGAWYTIKASIEPIVATQGQFQLICSGAAFAPGAGGAAYMASKAALEQLARALRIETAPYGVTVGTVYLGVVETDMTHNTLDADPLGKQVSAHLPWPFGRRLGAETVAEAMVTAIERRSPRLTRPRVWAMYSMLRGIVNPLIDGHLARSDWVRELVLQLDARLP